jgi:hypothetical protein
MTFLSKFFAAALSIVLFALIVQHNDFAASAIAFMLMTFQFLNLMESVESMEPRKEKKFSTKEKK